MEGSRPQQQLYVPPCHGKAGAVPDAHRNSARYQDKKARISGAGKEFEAKLASKGIRLDIYAEDDAGTAYDIEMQVAGSDKRNLGRRTRYYQSLMDDDALKKGMLYSRLRKSVIIFICTFDPFDRGLGRYTFSSLCREDNSLELGDEVTKVFINTTGDKHQLTRELVSLMEYINEGKVTDSFTEKLNDRVAALRDDDGKEALFMTYQQTLLEEKYKERINLLVSLVKENLISVTVAAQKAGFSESEFRKLACLG